jgi:hypothetical protein
MDDDSSPRPIGVTAMSPDQNDFDAIAADDRRLRMLD